MLVLEMQFLKLKSFLSHIISIVKSILESLCIRLLLIFLIEKKGYYPKQVFDRKFC